MPHSPVHSVWFWLILAFPFLSSLAPWIAGKFKLSLKPLRPWLWAGCVVSLVPNIFLEATNGHKVLRLACGTIFYSCFLMLNAVNSRGRFYRLPTPGAKWYLPWRGADISVVPGTRILVRDIDAVSPWYVEKLGLSKLPESANVEGKTATFSFNADGNSLVLTTRAGFQTGKTPMLFTRKIGKVHDVMAARGIGVGAIERDRQGIRYFQIHDPEGNEIEVVEGR